MKKMWIKTTMTYHCKLFFSFIFISWRLITLQYYSGFCHTLTWTWCTANFLNSANKKNVVKMKCHVCEEIGPLIGFYLGGKIVHFTSEYTTLENSWRVSNKTKHEILMHLAIVLMNIYSIGKITYIHIKYPHEYRKKTASSIWVITTAC